ncbi:MAG: sel1 repeat family protein [Muribaculaceae bacterium]|nr:sel1 repeat family protein [Muribaculaceae bacterium]
MERLACLIKKRLSLFLLVIGGTVGHAYADTETFNTESDGYEWVEWSDEFSFTRPTYCGAKNTSGKIIVPKKFFMVRYSNGQFHATLPNGIEALYSTDGRCIIPAERGYYNIIKHTTNNGDVYYSVENSPAASSYSYSHGICDANGKEIIPPQYPDLIYLDDKGFIYEMERDTSNDLIIIGDDDGPGIYEWVETGIGLDGQPFVKPQPQPVASSISGNSVVTDLLVKAEELFKQGKYEEACKIAMKINESSPRPDLQCFIGQCYTNMEKPEEAFKWYKQSAEAGFDEGLFRAGYCYYFGEGVTEDKNEAFGYFVLAAAQNNTPALLMLQLYTTE